jgi:hypothetical protein
MNKVGFCGEIAHADCFFLPSGRGLVRILASEFHPTPNGNLRIDEGFKMARTSDHLNLQRILKHIGKMFQRSQFPLVILVLRNFFHVNRQSWLD